MRQTLLNRAQILKKEGVIHREERERESSASCLILSINEHTCSMEFKSGNNT